MADIKIPSPDVAVSISSQSTVAEGAIVAAASALDVEYEDFGEDFAPPTSYARKTAIDVATMLSTGALRRFGKPLPVPEFDGCANGGVDLHWRHQQVELLVAVPPTEGRPILFYGDTPKPSHSTIKGILEDDRTEFLIAWLLERT